MKPEVIQSVNGWLSIFRIVTPALLSVLIWIVISGQTRHEQRLDGIENQLRVISNDYLHELSSIKERLTAVETQLKFIHSK